MKSNSIKNNTLDGIIDQSIYSIRKRLAGQLNKNDTKIPSLIPMLFGIINTKLGTPKGKKIRILLDSGASGTMYKTLLLRNYVLLKTVVLSGILQPVFSLQI